MLLPAAVSPPAAAPAALRVTAPREGHRQRAACANPTRLCCSAPFFPPLFSSHPKFFSIFFLARHPVSHQHLLAWAGEMLKGEQEVPGCCHCSAPQAGRGSNSAQITSRIFLQFVGLFYYCCYYLFIFFSSATARCLICGTGRVLEEVLCDKEQSEPRGAVLVQCQGAAGPRGGMGSRGRVLGRNPKKLRAAG